MADQDPQHDRTEPAVPQLAHPLVRGGEAKTSHEVELSPLLAAAREATAPAHEPVRLLYDPPSSAGAWDPIILDTPGPAPDLFPAPDEWKPKAAFPDPPSLNPNAD